jgi:hypothetical protein
MHDLQLLFRKDLFIVLNNIKLILKNPLRVLPYAFVLGYFSIFYFRRSTKKLNNDAPEITELQDAALQMDEIDYVIQNLAGGLTLIALIFLMVSLYRATIKNVSFFGMADVNLLFTAPVSPSMILVYYMIRSILPAVGGSIIFVLYSTAQLNDVFDLNFLNISMMVLGISLFLFMLSPIRFLVYTLNTKYEILPYIKAGVFGLGIALGAMVVIPGLMAEKFWMGMFAWIGGKWFDFFPLVGWSRTIFTYISHENLWLSLGFIAIYIITFLIILKLVLIHSGYYYEDVLESTKSNEEVKEKVKGKRENSESAMSLNTSKKLDLPDFGQGAIALYWRNYVHASRQDFHPLFGLYGLGFATLGILLAFLSHFDWFPHKFIYFYLLFQVLMYFLAGMGRTNVGDLKKPYFILIPASWTAKFWNMIRLDVYQTLIFSIVLIIPTVLIAQLHWLLILLFPFCLISFYLTGFAIVLSTQIGFDEGWDRKLIRPLIVSGVLIFGILPAIGVGVFAYLLTSQFVWGMLGICIGMTLVAGIMLHVTLDIISRLEFKEI